MQKFLAITGISGALFFGASVVPQDMQWQYAYQTPYAAQFIEYPEPSAPLFVPKPEARPAFPDDNGDGVVSVAVFTNDKGGHVYKQIPENLYTDIGLRNGHLKNPKETEMVTLFQAMKLATAEAAISFSTSTAANCGGAVSSCTFAGPNVAALSNTVMWINPFFRTQTDRAVSSVTYNGVNLTDAVNNARHGTAFPVYAIEATQWYLAAPSTGGYFNVVITLSGATDGASPYLSGFVSVYDGVAQTSIVDSSGKVEQNGTQGTIAPTTTVVGSTCWLVGVALDNSGSISTAGANTTFRATSVGNGRGADSNGIVAAGARALTWNRNADNGDQVGVVSSFCEPAVPGATTDNTSFDILD